MALTAVVALVFPSEIESEPVPEPVVTTTVADVAEVMFWEIVVTPGTPDSENVLLDHCVPCPANVSVMWPV